MEPEFLKVLLWSLGTGGITGAVWMGVVLFGRQKRLAQEHRELLADRQRILDHVEQLGNKLGEMEERLEFAERVAATPERNPRLPPAAGPAERPAGG